MAKKLSDALASLAIQTKNLEDKTSAARQESKDKLDKRIADIKAELQAKKDQFVKDIDEMNAKASGDWSSFKQSIDQKVNQIKTEAASKKDEIKEKLDEKKHDWDVSSAQKHYDRSLDYVSSCIDWASTALTEVEYAIYQSFEAKLKLDALQKK